MALDESRDANTVDTWRTPLEWVHLVRACLGEITLDPCADRDPRFHFARVNWDGSSPTQNGLIRTWYDGWFCNPPYGQALRQWACKAEEEAIKGREGIFLAPARTETLWFRTLAKQATLIAFPKRRIKFEDPTGQDRTGPKYPNVLVYFGRRPRQVTGLLMPSCTVLMPALDAPLLPSVCHSNQDPAST